MKIKNFFINLKNSIVSKFKNISKQKAILIGAAFLLVITHIAVLLAIFMSFEYYAIYPTLFGSLVCVIVSLLIIVDIIFFVGFNHKDLALKIVSCVLSFAMLIGGTIGTYYIGKVNGVVNSILDNGSNKKKEVFSGVFVCYDENNEFATLSDLQGKKIGFLKETSNGITYIATNILNKEKIDYGAVEYSTNNALLTALIDGDVDAVVITPGYRTIYDKERDENSPFASYLDNFIDFYDFEEELTVTSNKKAKNLNSDPFNVLLIGYSRTDIGSSVGLADSIIVATINPQTYTVSMMSIARDSFVPIPCYGGEYDKINSGRSTSRACFIETVENFLNMDIDYYMELDYLGLVQIVNTIGGIKISNPVEFELDGIYVPAGDFLADGQQALQFCRERHHMPNGDFDRQQHQKEVIIAIAKKFIEEGSVSLALEAMENASDWMSTDFTLNQLTNIFNLLLNTKNYTGLDTFDLVDFQTLRMTGSGGLMYYSYSMHLPLWVYLIYQDSYDESVGHINEIMGNYTSINQIKGFEFSAQKPYDRPSFYSLEYPNNFMFKPEAMPAYWPDFDGMTPNEAIALALEKGIDLKIGNVISAGDSKYNPDYEGLVCGQSVRYGSLISEYSSGTITVMGTAEVDESLLVPKMKGWTVAEAKEWAEENGVEWGSDDAEGIVTDQSCEHGTLIKACKILEVESEELETYIVTVEASPSKGGTVSGGGSVIKGESTTIKAKANTGYKFVGWDDGSTSAERTITPTKDVKYVAEFEEDGSQTKTEVKCDPTSSETDACPIEVDEEDGYDTSISEGKEGTWACTITYIGKEVDSVSCNFKETGSSETGDDDPEEENPGDEDEDEDEDEEKETESHTDEEDDEDGEEVENKENEGELPLEEGSTD